jgi:hypothetical protein
MEISDLTVSSVIDFVLWFVGMYLVLDGEGLHAVAFGVAMMATFATLIFYEMSIRRMAVMTAFIVEQTENKLREILAERGSI